MWEFHSHLRGSNSSEGRIVGTCLEKICKSDTTHEPESLFLAENMMKLFLTSHTKSCSPQALVRSSSSSRTHHRYGSKGLLRITCSTQTSGPPIWVNHNHAASLLSSAVTTSLGTPEMQFGGAACSFASVTGRKVRESDCIYS